jgi:hypothetical protein
VADYVTCVRAQGAKLGEERSKQLSAQAGYAGVNASVASEARERLEKSYATSDANTLEVIRACGAMRERDADRCNAAAALGNACGFEADPRFLGECGTDAEFQRCAASTSGDCNALALCGFAHSSRVMCGGGGKPDGSARCEETTKCQAACKQDLGCICGCNAKAMPASALAIGLQNQCFDVHCRGCAGQSCDACFQQHCSEKYHRLCEGH